MPRPMSWPTWPTRGHRLPAPMLAHPEATTGQRADQEEIAAIFADYDLLALSMVDEHDELIGQVTVDDIVDAIHEEATEDNPQDGGPEPFLLSAGIGAVMPLSLRATGFDPAVASGP